MWLHPECVERLNIRRRTGALRELVKAGIRVPPGCLARLNAANPGLGVQVVRGRTNDLLPQLAAGDLDVVIGRL